MADKPLTGPLPADLPEDWQYNQIVAPAGADVGLSVQHGYNYLMEQVNVVQEGVNKINEAFANLASLSADGKIPIEQLVIDNALSATSGNPVQNKIVQAAITEINNALNGKAASNHSHTAAQVGAAAANHSHTAAQVGAAAAGHGHTLASLGAAAANHGHDIAALGGCRIVTGQYTGDNVVRVQTNTGTGGFVTIDTVPTVVPNYITFAGGQFINLGARPKAILLAYNGENRYYGNDYVNLIIPNNQEVIWNPDYHVSRGLSGYYNNGSTAYRFFRLLEFADNGFYVGGSNTIQNTASLPFNKSGVIYNYMAII